MQLPVGRRMWVLLLTSMVLLSWLVVAIVASKAYAVCFPLGLLAVVIWLSYRATTHMPTDWKHFSHNSLGEGYLQATTHILHNVGNALSTVTASADA